MTTKSNPKTRIIVLIDSDESRDRKRPCFWQDKHWCDWFRDNEVSVSYVSIGDTLDSGLNPVPVLFHPDEFDILIVSWDTLNGDPVYRSDVARRFVQHYSTFLARLVNSGKIVLVEAQTVGYEPDNASYMALAPSDLDTGRDDWPRIARYRAAGAAVYRKSRCDHPVVDGIPKNKITVASLGPGVAQTRPLSVEHSARFQIEDIEKRLIFGCFGQFGPSWKPLLFADAQCHRPVLLVQDSSKNAGLYILTTMLLSNRSFKEGRILLLNLLHYKEKYTKYSEDSRTLRKTIVNVVLSTLAGLVVGMAVLYAAATLKIKDAPTIAAAVSTALVSMAAVFTLLQKRVKHRGAP